MRQPYTDGPKPRTDRGQRRHQARSDSEQKHAERVWTDRDVYISSLSSRTVLQGRAG
jgi:hypothetical protein